MTTRRGTTPASGSELPSRRSTIEDVASEAGVSVATVSRALRGLPNVAVSTRQRISAVADRLQYTPDPAASRLAIGRTQTVTVVVPTLSGWYFSTVVAGAEAVCAEAGYDVLVVGVGSHHDLGRILSESYSLERRTDGLVIVDIPIDPQQVASISGRGVAITTIGYATPGHPSIRIDNVDVGRIAAAHLIDREHQRLGLITGLIEDPLNFSVPRLRRSGFTDELERCGLELDDRFVAHGNFGIDGGREALSALLDLPEPPTAVFSISDEMAFGALMELGRRGLRPGRDIAILGVDDHEFSQVVALTTVRQPVADHGAAATRLLLEAMHRDEHEAGATESEVVAPVELVIRSTT